MALIPPDAGVRLRMQTEASLLQPLSPVREIPGELPELQTGQAFAARVVEALPDNLYKALVTGKLLTLQLPEGAKPGDSLELVVVDRTARAIVAQRVDGQSTAAQQTEVPVQQALISRAGQMIGQLLAAEGETPQPASLNGGQPLLAEPPQKATDLAPVLAKAVSQSGLFYEAHQAEWVAGRRTIESLQAEPHSQLAQYSPVPAAASARETTAAAGTQAGTTPSAQPTHASNEATNLAQAVPDALRPLVQQQLDAIATQRMMWHGEVWPGQNMEFEVGREQVDDRDAAVAPAQAENWNTTLRLSMPRLGALDATLQLAGNSLRVKIRTASDDAAGDLRANAQALATGMTDAGLRLQTIEIARGEEE